MHCKAQIAMIRTLQCITSTIYFTMKIYEFLSLEDRQQYQTVWELGTHIDDIILDKMHYQLYAVGDFYVEIHYSTADNKIIGKLAFRTGVPLEKYLNQWPSFDSM